MADTYFPWMDELKTLFQTVHTAAKTAELTDNAGQVHIYSELPEMIRSYPTTLITFVSGGDVYSAGGVQRAEYDIQVTLYVARASLPDALSTAAPFVILVKHEAAKNLTLSGTVEDFEPPMLPERWWSGPGNIVYGDEQHTGLIFKFIVRVNESGVYPVNA